MALSITIREENPRTTIVAVSGRLDAMSAAAFEAAALPISENATVEILVFDGAGLEYVASAGLRVFLQVIKHMSAKKAKIFAINLCPTVKGVLEMTGLIPFIELRPGLAECLA